MVQRGTGAWARGLTAALLSQVILWGGPSAAAWAQQSDTSGPGLPVAGPSRGVDAGAPPVLSTAPGVRPAPAAARPPAPGVAVTVPFTEPAQPAARGAQLEAQVPVVRALPNTGGGGSAGAAATEPWSVGALAGALLVVLALVRATGSRMEGRARRAS